MDVSMKGKQWLTLVLSAAKQTFKAGARNFYFFTSTMATWLLVCDEPTGLLSVLGLQSTTFVFWFDSLLSSAKKLQKADRQTGSYHGALKDRFTTPKMQLLFTNLHAEMECGLFPDLQNVPRASQQNSIAAFSWTTWASGHPKTWFVKYKSSPNFPSAWGCIDNDWFSFCGNCSFKPEPSFSQALVRNKTRG